MDFCYWSPAAKIILWGLVLSALLGWLLLSSWFYFWIMILLLQLFMVVDYVLRRAYAWAEVRWFRLMVVGLLSRICVGALDCILDPHLVE